MNVKKENIRNFSIIAHIDHGKSTLADRLLEQTGTIEKRLMKEQLLDQLDLERERGITIKLNAVTLTYNAPDGEQYILNLIDTPGHVDFAYEVSRSLAACEGALLVVDASQGVEAQTLANVYLAIDNDLEIIPIINKVDLPSADIDRVKEDIENRIGLSCENAIGISAKTGLNIDKVLEAIVALIPPPSGDENKPLSALIFDSFYDSYRGVVVMIRVKDGKVKVGDTIRFMSTNKEYLVTEVGLRHPYEEKMDELVAGEVGYLAAQIKDIRDVHTGDTITLSCNPTETPLPGYRKMNPMVYCGLYPVDSKRYEDLKDSLEKLCLNDSSLHFEPETSKALGFGFRCGFLGLLHMDVVQERLEREYQIDLILTAPSVIYHVYKTDGAMISIDNPSDMPPLTTIKEIQEPFVIASIMTPQEFVGPLMTLCQDRRGVYIDLQYFDDSRMILKYELPLSEIVYNFFDKLKSYSKGYASFDYQKGNAIVSKLKEIIPRQQFEVPVQAAVNNKVVARSDIKAVRKDVLAKCYGGDISHKKKLLEKQKEGKKRMKNVGSVEVPQEAFMAVLSIDDDEE